MSEVRDPAIKLFGRKIALPEDQPVVEGGDIAELTPEVEQDPAGEKDPREEKDEASTHEMDHKKTLNSAEAGDKPSAEEPDPGQDHKESDTSGGEGKALKKPDKILPCPRCNSMDTKFCYYNNYNVNQPRHFCKNCQRYWTAGGTMRNVPVGAGRRKNKHSSTTFRHAVVATEALASVQADATSGAEAPLCESMASALNRDEQNGTCELGFRKSPSPSPSPSPSCSSSFTGSKNADNVFVEFSQQNVMNGVTPYHHLQSFPGLPWPACPWNQAAAMTEPATGQENGILLPLSWSRPPPPPPMVAAATAFYSPTFPFPLLPAPFWCWNGPWNFPWAATRNGLTPSSPTLGKHSREATSMGEKKEKSLWVPKTLRIDDPDAAAKSSIFATLGIKPDEVGIFKVFPSAATATQKAEACEAKQALHANPAALSRSQSFREAA